MALQPIPPPGLATFPQFLSNSSSSQTFVMRGESAIGSDWNVTDGAGNPFLAVSADSFSLSHRKHLIDAVSGKEICEIRSESFSSSYRGAAPDGTELVYAEHHFHFSGSEWTLNFVNNAAGGQRSFLTCKERDGIVVCEGNVVAILKKKTLSMKGQYDLEIAPGLDPFLIVALVVILSDREKSRSSAAAAGSAGGGGA